MKSIKVKVNEVPRADSENTLNAGEYVSIGGDMYKVKSSSRNKGMCVTELEPFRENMKALASMAGIGIRHEPKR